MSPGKEPYIMAGGLRDTDGMIVEAKDVRNRDTCFRTLGELEKYQQGVRGKKTRFEGESFPGRWQTRSGSSPPGPERAPVTFFVAPKRGSWPPGPV